MRIGRVAAAAPAAALAARVDEDVDVSGQRPRDVLPGQTAAAAVALELHHGGQRAVRVERARHPGVHRLAAEPREDHVLDEQLRHGSVGGGELGPSAGRARLLDRAEPERVEVGRLLHLRAESDQFGVGQVGDRHRSRFRRVFLNCASGGGVHLPSDGVGDIVAQRPRDRRQPPLPPACAAAVCDSGSMAAPARPTLDAIAREASVSLSTVSKVLNGRPGVSPSTRRRVEDLLHDSGYARRGVDAERGETVELVIENLASEWSVEVIRGVERVARENGLPWSSPRSATTTRSARSSITGVLRRKPVASRPAVLEPHRRPPPAAAHPEHPVRRRRPRGRPSGEDVPAIGATNWAGGLAATRHLLRSVIGASRAIGGPSDLMCSRARVAGYQAALQEAGIPVPREVGSGGFSREDGEREGRRLLGRGRDRPTAIVCANDMQALGVYDAAFALGLDVPRDLSVVGFDDAPSASWARPPLTTIRQPLQEMAEEATRLALRLRAGDAESTRWSWRPPWSSAARPHLRAQIGRPRKLRPHSPLDPLHGPR